MSLSEEVPQGDDTAIQALRNEADIVPSPYILPTARIPKRYRPCAIVRRKASTTAYKTAAGHFRRHLRYITS